MKSLDEVIEALDVCQRSACDKCPYYDSNVDICFEPVITDALQWLKGYKGHIELDKIRDKCEAENEPLSWEELKQMEGKPVWVVEEGYQTWEYWSLVYWMKDDELTLFNENGQTTYLKNEQGTVWQAYRKERG